jgi:hypothetical protein
MTWRQKFDTDLLGFAGHFTWQPSDESNGTCTWHHRLAITPRLRPDTSCYRWLGPDDFLEHGTCKDDQGQTHAFVEHWHRVHADPIHVWMLNRDGTRGQALIADPWAIVIYDLRKDPLTPSDPVSFEGFCAHAWQRVSGTWQIEFGSHAYLGADPMWTPETLTHPGSEGAWQCTSPSLGQGGP